jgi:hypothetical protein
VKIEIKHRYSGHLLFEIEAGSWRLALEAAVKARADLQGAYLRGADLRDTYLQDADLQGADLQDADLQGADLQGADLRGADLRDTYLQDADLQGAYLQGADLQGAYLQGADLQGAYLRGAWHILTISPIGSRGDMLVGVIREGAVWCKTGCFWGTVDGFEAEVMARHTGQHHDDYAAVIALLRIWGATRIEDKS